MAWSRDNALMSMTSPLGTDVLIPIALSAREAISTPFHFSVDVVSQQGVVQPDDLLNQPVCVALNDNGTPLRYFHGIVQNISAEGSLRSETDPQEFQLHRLTVVPRLWFLSQTVDCRVYQKLSTADILKAMFADAGLTDIGGIPSASTREYTVQFNESDLHFATRLMEEEGWYYFFQHSASAHKLVIANQNGTFTDISNATLYVTGGDSGTWPLSDFNTASATARGKMTLKDYDPTNPDTLLKSDQPTVAKTGGKDARDDFRWPAVTFEQGTVTNRAKWEMEAAEAAATVLDGACRFGGLVPGGKFTVSSKPASPLDGSYVVRSVNHQARDDGWISVSGTASYGNRFTAFPSATTWREHMTTPRPRMEGVHTALVMGPQSNKDSDIKSQSGEEIYTDDLARVKVRFYWDWRREATGDMAVWARVIQPWAGKSWGAQFIPRVGTEVAVAFVDGDPDRPIVLGGLYNGRDTPIYAASDKTKLGFRTRSSLSGSTSQFNEFTFDDKADSELIFMHAQKDLTTEVENDQTLKVDHDRKVTVKNDETVDIQNNQTIKVKQDRAVTVTDGNSTFEVSKGNHSSTIDQGNNSLTVSKGNDSVTVSMGNSSLTVSTGNYTISVDAGQMSVSAAQSISLTVGGSSIKISPSGITVSGPQISLSADGQGSFDGGGMLALKGGMVNINS